MSNFVKKCYQTLGLNIARTYSKQQLRDAFLGEVKKWHPDRFISQSKQIQEDAESRFKDAVEAYEILTGKRTPNLLQVAEPEASGRVRKQYADVYASRRKHNTTLYIISSFIGGCIIFALGLQWGLSKPWDKKKISKPRPSQNSSG
mmetsp:Transcript_36375/g.58808  ORF Transcript_36375/g.58808 Transcript_36375/m.58808 type:complete len:146 (-) Transcript_36375:182-619(-)